MNSTAKLIALVGTSCALAFATAAPALADSKPCCRNNGQYFESSPTTCRNNGGRVVDLRYCVGEYGRRGGSNTNFSVTLGNVTFAYSDGYYDRDRRWHNWRSDNERKWYQKNRRASYHNVRRDRDQDRKRRDWRNGKRNDWR